MSDLLPIPALPPAPPEPQRQPGRWWRLTHPRAARQARLLAAHHAWTTERARQAQIDLVRAGYHLGPVPYGYQPHRVTLFNHQGQPRRHVRLVIDPGPAALVATIFRLRVDHQVPTSSIATSLQRIQNQWSDISDPATGLPRPWTSTSVGRILANPVYTGATVWGRTANGQPVPPDQWVICPHAHEPIIDGRTFHRAQLLAPASQGVFSPRLLPWEFLGSDGPHGEGIGQVMQ
ncbi:recombinase family protein [Pseudofrankia asymbiotica]|uniref:Recombinase n=1 Tax=Pseudofrankia asymbiotica TaxID=1834516 RepID=A0A1V2I3T3_9ACTN|nr:recombinase family protein [Pseudofrankia asymbiotica]ONH25235.1 recombinase [Pseudofrankia asymbiotica]